MPDNPDITALDELWTALQGAAGSSYVVTLGTAALAPFRRTASRLTTFTRDSYLYRWLTKEPDPEIIVIDLRETYTVGPFIELLDYLLARFATYGRRFEPYWEDSTLNRFVSWSNRQIQRAANTQPGRVVRALLNPPEPPQKEDGD